MTSPSLQLNLPALLARIPLFAGLDVGEIQRIAASTREVAVPRGGILFNRGDKNDGFYIVVYGQMKLAFTSPQGSEKVVEIISPGHSFGEAVMFMDKPYPVMAQALADSQLLHIGRAALFGEIDRDPKLARKMIAGLSMRLHRLIADVESYSLHSARERVIGYLLREAPDDDASQAPYEIHLPTSKGTLASRLNITQEHFSRLLHDLAERGLIEVAGRNIRVPNLDKLRNFSAD
jgi:CRP/FNR family transcriptional regulator, dissimilatory nitrate respiration regulator